MKIPIHSLIVLLLMLVPGINRAQFISITGFISDKTGNLLENVNVYESRTGIGTLSNSDGSFQLLLPSSKIDLNISIRGYQSLEKQLELSSDTVISLILTPVSQIPDEEHKSLRAASGTSEKPSLLRRIF